jgi:hypothetical protein
MTPTQKALAVDRLAKAVNPSVVTVQDYLFGLLPKPEFVRPERNEEEELEDYRTRVEAARTDWKEANPNVFGITHWDTEKLGPQPTEEEIAEEVSNESSPKISAEQHIARSLAPGQEHFIGIRTDALQDIEAKLAAAGKTAPKIAAIREWIDGIVGLYATDLQPRNDWTAAPHTFEETIQEAAFILSQ